MFRSSEWIWPRIENIGHGNSYRVAAYQHIPQLPSATLGMHALGLGVAIIEHAFIVVFIQVRLRQLKRAAVAV